MNLDRSGLFSRLRQAPAFANFGWLAVDKVIRLVLGFFVGLWVARYLGPPGFGIITYGVAVASLVAVIPALGLDGIVRRQIVRSPADAGRILGTTFGLRLLVAATAYGLLLFGAFVFEPNVDARLAIALAGLSLLLQPVLAIDLWFQSQLLSKYTVAAHNVSFIICSALRVAGILRGATLHWFLYLLAVEICLTSLLLVVAYRRGRRQVEPWRWDSALAWQLLREAWPLALAAMATLIYVRIDQVMIRSIAGPAETGLYAAAARVLEILHTLPIMLAASLSPGLVRAREGNREEYFLALRRFFNLAAGSAWLATLACAFTAPWLVPLLFGPAYASTTGILMVLAFSLPLIAMGVARQEYLINEGRQKFQLVTTLIGATTNVALNLWAIPRWGGLGAAVVTLASHLAADLLSSLLWPPARMVGRWQLQALAGLWRLAPASPRPVT